MRLDAWETTLLVYSLSYHNLSEEASWRLVLIEEKVWLKRNVCTSKLVTWKFAILAERAIRCTLPVHLSYSSQAPASVRGPSVFMTGELTKLSTCCPQVSTSKFA